MSTMDSIEESYKERIANLRAEINKSDNLICELGMQIDQINNILNGEELCDFAMSFPLVRKVADKMAGNADLLNQLKPIRAVWEQYKHLDALLSDIEWLDGDEPPSPQRKCLFDCWMAIRAANKP